uniref:Ymf100 n=1 Tax=Peronospora belbahrii TaxID=622444 RepID=UPI0020294C05|nr:Ymf100 [Peronospora belbahrii]DAZ88073.1 TPA_asm: Ymf100 [Peronospora belbahrii]
MQKKKNYRKKDQFSRFYKYKNYLDRKNNIYYILGEQKPSKPLTTAYLHRNKKKKIGIFFKKPSFRTILYPFHLNLKLINEYLKKK